MEVLQTVAESVPIPDLPDVNINPEFNIGIVQNINKRDAEKDSGVTT